MPLTEIASGIMPFLLYTTSSSTVSLLDAIKVSESNAGVVHQTPILFPVADFVVNVVALLKTEEPNRPKKCSSSSLLTSIRLSSTWSSSSSSLKVVALMTIAFSSYRQPCQSHSLSWQLYKSSNDERIRPKSLYNNTSMTNQLDEPV